jgi:N-acetylglutamate synthase-like GNAT family acetyltransferase
MSEPDRSRVPSNITIRHYFRPGDIGTVTRLHGTIYAEAYGWDYTFEAYVAGPLAEFARSISDREGIWLVERDGQIVGSAAIVDAGEGAAQLRWLLLRPECRGQGLGRILVEDAIRFCRGQGYRTVFLWTVSILDAAINLYRSVGFCLTEETTHELWGDILTEQRYDLAL